MFLGIIMKTCLFVTISLGWIYILSRVGGQLLTRCPCNRTTFGNFTTAWGKWLDSTPECIGECNNASQTGNRDCLLTFTNGTMYGSTRCRDVTFTCDSCIGAWSKWGSIGKCSNGCGIGLQTLQRTCYERARSFQIASCFGGPGQIVQNKTEPCVRMISCNNTTQPSSAAATTSILSVVTTSTSNAPPTTTNSETSQMRSVENTTSISTTTTTTTTTIQTITTRTRTSRISNPPVSLPVVSNLGGIDTVALAAVLGTAAIISVTVVAITAAIVFLRKKSPDSHVISYTSSNGEVVVAGVSLSRRNYHEDQTVLSHALYELDSVEGDVLLGNGLNAHRPSSSRNTELEGVYSVVDDRNKD